MGKAEMPKIVTKQLGKFEIIGVKPGPVLFNKKTIDLDRITEAEAEKLLEEGLPYIQRKAVTKAPEKPAGDSEKK